MNEQKKLTWWQFIKQDNWHLWFVGGFLSLSVILYFHFFVEEFLYLEITDNIGFNSVWLGIILFSGWMIKISYSIFYKEWKEYLKDPKA